MFHVGSYIVNRRNHVPSHLFSDEVTSNVELHIGDRISQREAKNRHAVAFRHEVRGMDGGRLIEN